MSHFLLPFRDQPLSLFLSPLGLTLSVIISLIMISLSKDYLAIVLIFLIALILLISVQASVKHSIPLIISGFVIIFFLGLPSFFLNKGELIYVFQIFSLRFPIYSFGVHRALSIWLKGLCSVSLVTLYSSAVTMQEFIQSLRALFVPNIIILIVLMILRYTPMFYKEAKDIRLAQRLRGLDYAPRKRRFLAAASMFGSTLIKSLIHGEEVFHAMILRGLERYDIVKRAQIKWMDPIFLVLFTVIISFLAGGIIQWLLI